MKSTKKFVALKSGDSLLMLLLHPVEYAESMYSVVESESLSGLLGLLEVDNDLIDKAIEAYQSSLTKEAFRSEIPEKFKEYFDLKEIPESQFCVEPVVPSFESLKELNLRNLNAWWDGIPGIEAQPGIVLPIDKASIGAMGVAATVAMQMGKDLSLDDVNDKTVVIPSAKIQEAIGTFYTKLNELRAKWDDLLAKIESATTIEELNQISF